MTLDAQKEIVNVSCIDLKKAYDSINRDILWSKLNDVIENNLYNTIKSLYSNVTCSVKTNSFYTGWFYVRTGLKQGCALSPMLFNLYINHFAIKIDALNKGIDIDGANCAILLFADDIVLISDNAQNLQCLLHELDTWCNENHMCMNATKILFILEILWLIDVIFSIDVERHRLLVSQYQYLGLVLSD